MLWQRILASKLTVLFAGMATGAITAPLLGRAVRPLVRTLIKAGLVVQDELVHIAADMREELQDLVAEARHELGEHHAHGERDHHRHHHDHDRAQA